MTSERAVCLLNQRRRQTRKSYGESMIERNLNPERQGQCTTKEKTTNHTQTHKKYSPQVPYEQRSPC